MANLAAMSIRHLLAVFILMGIGMSFVWSRALLSIGMGFLAIVAAFDIQVSPFRIKWMLTPKAVYQSIKDKPYMWGFAVFFLLYLVSIIYAGNMSEWWKLTHPKLAFILLPMSFAMLQPFTRKEVMLVIVCLIITAVWSSIWVQVAYYSNYDLFSKSLGFGGSLPTPSSHIRYSVTIAMCIVLCIGFVVENWKLKYNWERLAYGIIAAYLFYFLHVLSVRSGLVLAYTGIILMTIFYMRRIRVWKQIALFGIILLAPFIAYKTLPGFQLKVNYTFFDLNRYVEGQGDDYSDSQRWESWRAGIAIGNEHPLFGIGTGKFRARLDKYYQDENKPYVWRPQNQWINVFAIFGLFGLTVFSFMIIYPMSFRLFWLLPVLPAMYIMQLVLMIVEHPLDSEVGTILFLVLTLLPLSYQAGINEKSTSA